MDLDKVVSDVVALIPDREFYGKELRFDPLRRMRHDLAILSKRRIKEPDLDEVFRSKQIRYNQVLKRLALTGKQVLEKRLLAYNRDKKAEVLMDLITRHRLLKYLERTV
ncbi:hypothetical protein [Streptococcus sobrinus]|uniref:hypothetical protein n=1 Tax=Streptococcus sobrinus TaxID=1310 RepID=UPI00031FE90B|nr:hypothetical protein [Streptococcus sobrinus]